MPTPRRSSRAFRALRHHDFRLFFFGHGLSVIGTWLQHVAVSWLTYRLTESAVLLGVVAFSQHIAVLVLAPFAGVVSDRLDRRRAVFVTQALQLALSGLLAGLTLAGVVAIWHIVAVVTAMGVVTAFDVPFRQALVAQLIEDRADLPNAIALNSLLINVARVAGPALAGVLVALVGEGWCFALNSASYLAALLALGAMHWRHALPVAGARGWWETWVEGIRYVRDFVPIRDGLLLVAAFSWTIGPYTTLMPIFARETYGGGPGTLGTLLAAAGVGAMTGMLVLASRTTTRDLDRFVVRAGTAALGALAAFALCRVFGLALPLLAVMGFGFMASCASLNTLIQTVVDEDKRGRVMSLYAMAFIGVSPVGNLAAGTLAGALGAPAALLINAVLGSLAVAWFARRIPRLRELVRPAYVRAGFIRDPAA